MAGIPMMKYDQRPVDSQAPENESLTALIPRSIVTEERSFCKAVR